MKYLLENAVAKYKSRCAHNSIFLPLKHIGKDRMSYFGKSPEFAE